MTTTGTPHCTYPVPCGRCHYCLVAKHGERYWDTQEVTTQSGHTLEFAGVVPGEDTWEGQEWGVYADAVDLESPAHSPPLPMKPVGHPKRKPRKR